LIRAQIGIEMKVENGGGMVAVVDPAYSFRTGIREGVEIDFQLNVISLTSCFGRRRLMNGG
jgi:hypothetical protein